MSEPVRPRVVVSRCLGFEPCRWNGGVVENDFVRRLSAHADVVTPCPETDMGLGVPRRPIRIVAGPDRDTERPRLVQPATGLDVTDGMTAWCERFLDGLDEPDGFLLKHRSPSCGISGVRIYASADKPDGLGNRAGFFGAAALERFGDLPVEDEGRLNNYLIREHFLTRVFTLARFRAAREAGGAGDLVRFQSEHKYLLMLYDQERLRELGRITANHEKRPPGELFDAFAPVLRQALSKQPEHTQNINVLQHVFGHFSKNLSVAEKEYFLDLLEEYRRGGQPLSVPVGVLRAWVARFEDEYLASQHVFRPYPDDLIDITDSGKGRAR